MRVNESIEDEKTDDLLVGLKQVSSEFMSLIQHLLQCIVGFLTVHG